MVRWFAFVLASAWFIPQVGKSQTNFRVKRMTLEGEELNAIHQFFQDSRGYIWMGSTEDGLMRFDGHSFRVFGPAELSSAQFTNTYSTLLFHDKRKDLWIGTNDGALMRYDPSLDKFQTINDSSTRPKALLYCQIEDVRGNFWMGSMGDGLIRFNPVTKSFKSFKAQPGNPSSLVDNYVTGLAFAEGKLWVSTTRGLCSLDTASNIFEFQPLTNNSTDTYRYQVIRSMMVSSEGLFYLCTYGGLQIFDPKTEKSKHFISGDETGLNHNSLFRASEDKNGIIWIASYGGGLNRFDPTRERFTSWQKDVRSDGLATNNFFSVFVDNQGLIWLGAADHTVSIYNPRTAPFHSLEAQSGNSKTLSSGWVRCWLQENDSIYWLGLNGSGLNRVNLRTGIVDKFEHDPKNEKSLGHNSVAGIDWDTRGNMWVGLEGGGLNMLSSDFKTFKRLTAGRNSINNNAVSALIVDRDDFVWATTYRDGLNIYDINENTFTSFNNDSLAKFNGISLAETRGIYELNNQIWFNTSNRIIVYDKLAKQFVNLTSKPQVVSGDRSTSFGMVKLSEEEMAVISDSSIVAFRYHSPSHIEKSSLYQGVIGKASMRNGVIDKQKNLWLASGSNLVKLDLGRNIRQAFGAGYGIKNAIHNIQIDRGGRLFLLTTNGINWLDPDQVQDDTLSRKIVFTDFKLFNRTVPLEKPDSITQFALPGHIGTLRELNLTHRQSFFTIHFAALEFYNAEAVHYAYRLIGYDQEWVEIGNQRFASYTNLDPGTYQFEVKATTPGGIWGVQQASLTINILPPFWKTWWFITFVLAAIAGTLYSLHLYRLGQRLGLERLRTKIASDLHDEVGSSLTRISMYSELTQQTINEKEKSHYLDNIGSLSREVVGTMSDIVWSIDNNYDTLEALILRMKDLATDVLQTKNIELKFTAPGLEVSRVLGPAVRQSIYLIFKEAINNVVKHAHATRVSVQIFIQQQLTMTIEDNGIGIPNEKTHKGNGLRNMYRRAKSIGGHLTVSQNKGTTITLSLPAKAIT